MKKMFSNLFTLMMLVTLLMFGHTGSSQYYDPPIGATCYSTYQGTWIGGHKIWHCLHGGFCEKVRAKKFEYFDPGECTATFLY
jgi:hypothetical protein